MITDEMTIRVERELSQTLLVVEESGIYRENYQVRMLRANRIEGLLSISARGIDERTVYTYDISGKVSMKNRFAKKKIGAKEIKKFLEKISGLISELSVYLLSADCLILNPEYIFWEEGEYAFCYVPQREGDVWTDFHKLMEYFVQWTDYQDTQSVRYSFLLHKETMKENYSLRKIMEKMDKMAQEDKENKKAREEETLKAQEGQRDMNDSMTADSPGAESDWITPREMGKRTLRETEEGWTPIKRFLQKHKRPKWGDWDGLYIDEEEL